MGFTAKPFSNRLEIPNMILIERKVAQTASHKRFALQARGAGAKTSLRTFLREGASLPRAGESS